MRRNGRWFGLASVAVALLLTGCGAFPSNAKPAPVRTPSAAVTEAGVVYRTIGGQSLSLDAYLPAHPVAKPTPAVVVVHGGSFTGGNKREVDAAPVSAMLSDAGYAAFSIDYRLLPASHYPDALSDLQAAVRWLREPAQVARFGIDPARIGALGGSAGAILVSEAGTAGSGPLDVGARLRAVVEFSGVMDFTDRGLTPGVPSADRTRGLAYLGCSDPAACPPAREASALYAVDPTDPPFFLIHSIDEDLPEQSTVALADALKAAGVPVVLELRPGTKHSLAILDGPLGERIIKFLGEHL